MKVFSKCFSHRSAGRFFLLALLVTSAAATGQAYHAADSDLDFSFSLYELLRVIQFYNLGEFCCSGDSEDGYAPGDSGPRDCAPHTADTDANWSIDLSELLRVIQIYNVGAYHTDCDAPDRVAPGVGARQQCYGMGVSFFAGTRNAYAPGVPVPVTMTIAADFLEDFEVLTAIGVKIIFPYQHWSFVEASPGSAPVVQSGYGSLEFIWIGVPRLPHTFTYVLHPSAGVHGPQTFEIILAYRMDGPQQEIRHHITIQEAAPGTEPGVGPPVECPNISFWDPRLNAAVYDALGAPAEGVTLCNVQTLESLDISGYGISYLTDLEVCSNLREIDASNNDSRALEYMPVLPGLERLNLANCNIRDVRNLSISTNFPNLTWLDLRGNPLTLFHACDLFASLSSLGMTVVHDLACGDAETLSFGDPMFEAVIRDALDMHGGPLFANDMLTVRTLTVNGLARLEGLEVFLNLESFTSDHGTIGDLTPLAGLTKLQFLSLIGNEIEVLSPLNGLSGLETLYLDHNLIRDLAPIANLPKLNKLWIDDNNLDSLEPLTQLPSLSILTANFNPGLDIAPIASMSRLDTLYLVDTGLTDLSPLTNLRNLRALHVALNRITDLQPLIPLAETGAFNTLYVTLHQLGSHARDVQVPLLLDRGVRVQDRDTL